jgi:hypothetical protein
MKKVYVSENIIDDRAKTRLMKVEDCGTTVLYIARSKSDTKEDNGYTILTPINCPLDSPRAKSTTPIMKLDGYNRIAQMYRGQWVGDTTADHMDYDDITYFHPHDVQDLLNLLSMTSWFACDDFDESAFSVDDGIDGKDRIIHLKVASRNVKSVSYLMRYEQDISMYKLYRIEEIKF